MSYSPSSAGIKTVFNYFQSPTPKPGEEFVKMAETGTIPPKFDFTTIDHHRICEGLIAACRKGRLDNAQLILTNCIEGEIEKDALGEALACAMALDEDPRKILDSFINSYHFADIDATYISRAFQKGVIGKHIVSIRFFLDQKMLYQKLSPQDIFGGLVQCVMDPNDALFDILLKSNLALDIPKQKKEDLKKLYLTAIDKSKWALLTKFAQIPCYREVLMESASEILMKAIAYAMAKDEDPRKILDTFIDSNIFADIDTSYVSKAFQNAVAGKHIVSIRFFLEQKVLSQKLSPQDILGALALCVADPNDALFDTLIKCSAAIEVPKKKKEDLKKLYITALDKSKWELLAKFARTSGYREVLMESAGELLIHAAKTKPIGVINRILIADWGTFISDEDLAKAAIEGIDDNLSVNFKQLIIHPRCDRIYRKGSIISELKEEKAQLIYKQNIHFSFCEEPTKRSLTLACMALIGCEECEIKPCLYEEIEPHFWFLGISNAIEKGQTAHIVPMILSHPRIIQNLTPQDQASLFQLSCETTQKHSSAWAVAKAMLETYSTPEQLLRVLPQSIVDGLLVFANELSFFEMVAMLLKLPHLAKTDPDIIRRVFVNAASTGFLKVVKMILNSARASEIKEAEIGQALEYFFIHNEKPNMQEMALLLFDEPHCRKIPPKSVDEIFSRLYQLLPEQEQVCFKFIFSPCFNHVGDDIIEEILAPLVELGTVREEEEGIPHKEFYAEGYAHTSSPDDKYWALPASKPLLSFKASYATVMNKRTIFGPIIQTDRFVQYFNKDLLNPSLYAIFRAATGLGFLPIVSNILARFPGLPTECLNLAAFQACSNTHFFLFHKQTGGKVIPKGHEIPPTPIGEKAKILDLILDRLPTNLDFAKSWILLYCKYGSPEVEEIFFNHYPDQTAEMAKAQTWTMRAKSFLKDSVRASRPQEQKI